MINAIRSEWIKFRSVRSNLILLAAGAALTIAIGGLQINDLADNGNALFRLSDINAGVQIAVFLFGALGVQILGQEYRFNTIRPTFSATPNRGKVLAAKFVVVTVACAAVTLAMMAVLALMGSLFLPRFEMDSVDFRIIWSTALFAAGWSAMGLGVGAILRQPIAGIIVLLVEGTVAEGILVSIFHGLAKWAPFQNGVQMTGRPSDYEQDIVYRSILGGGIYFFLVMAVVLGIGVVLAQRRDA